MSRVAYIIVLSLTAIAAASGCSDDPRPAADASPPPIDTPPLGDAAVDTPPSPMPCPDGQVCFQVKPVVAGATIPAGRVAVVFYQFDDDLEPAPLPLVAYDAPFAGGATTSIQIPLDGIHAPKPTDDYSLCLRACESLEDPACDCPKAQARVTTAFVFVLSDSDSSGSIELAEIREENLYGVGYMHLIGADHDYPLPNALDFLLIEGILEGLRPYRIIPGSPFDNLGIPAPNTTFDLDVCVPADPSCALVRFPNLT